MAPGLGHTGETEVMGPGLGAYRGDGGGWTPAWGHSGETIRGSGPWCKTIASRGLLLAALLFFIRVCRLADNRHFDLGCITM